MTLRLQMPRRTIGPVKSNIIPLLETSRDVSYVLDSQFVINYCNPAWDRFAYRNGGKRLTLSHIVGASVWDFTPWELQPFFAMVFDHVHSRGEVWRHTYDCSSPRVHRICEMSVHPLSKPDGYLVTNTMLIEEPHEHGCDPNPVRYHDSDSRVIICSHCSFTKAVGNKIDWDFVPGHLGLPLEQVMHDLCPLCRSYLYAPSLWLSNAHVTLGRPLPIAAL